jgi:iron complex outermembrane recepter protein
LGITCTKRSARFKTGQWVPPARTAIGAAVCVALYGMPHFAIAQQQPSSSNVAQQQPPSSGELEEVTVTASRREETLESVPYSLSVVSGDEMARTGVTDLASLAAEVPGLAYYDFGARQAGATVPIIRGLNASDVQIQGRAFRTFEQSPVGTYIGNSPFDGYLQLDDIQRVEVLRGPQGTLYGAGALGGALRIMPNAPELGVFSGKVEASTGLLAEANDKPYTTSALLNVPIGDTVALRASAKYSYEPGWINVYGILKHTGSGLSETPVLADPSDPVNSPGVYSGKTDWNDQNSFTGRTSLLWKPNDTFNAQLAFIYASVNGDGGPYANPSYPGGAYVIDPRITFPAGSANETFSAIDQPFWRRTTLSTADLSYDVGFATLASTSSYATTKGSTMTDGTYILGTTNVFNTKNYYGGSPLNPRFVQPNLFTDSEQTFDEEIRLVSKNNPGDMIDYVGGLFYEDQNRFGGWYSSNPGSPERAVTQGCTSQYYAGAAYPACLLTTGPGDANFQQLDNQHFTDKSEFAEVTWHFASHAQITFGGRHFDQQFTDAQSYLVYTYGTLIPPSPRSAPASKNTWKINPSYEYSDGQYVYALWSQGFRRGGANSVPLVGIYKESPLLQTYAPDSVNNYETGLKGRFGNNFSYTFAIFDIRWDKPQISGTLPDGNLAVYNANTAESRGFEFETKGPLFIRGLTYSVGGAYADARLTSSFSLPANNGAGVVTPGLVTGAAGDQLPGSPKTSVSATLIYDRVVVPGYDLVESLNATYRSATPLLLGPQYSAYQTPQYGIVNFNSTLSHQSWRLGIYSTNLLDKRVVLAPYIPNNLTSGGGLIENNTYNMPREIGLRVSYSF